MKKGIFAALLFVLPCTAEVSDAIKAHLLLGDNTGAASLLEEQLKKTSNTDLLESAIALSATQGHSRELLKYYRAWLAAKHEGQDERPVLEQVAWGILKSGLSSPIATSRLLTVSAGAICQDHRGAELLIKGLQDSNGLVRVSAVQAAMHYPDSCVTEALVKAYRNENDWRIRMEFLRAIGQLRIVSMQEELFITLEDPSLKIEERALAAQAIVNMTDDLSASQIASLAGSDRAGLRYLSAIAIDFLQKHDERSYLLLLAKDRTPQVAVSALNALRNFEAVSLSSDQELDVVVSTLMQSGHQAVSLAAAQVAFIRGDLAAEAVFLRWLNSGSPHDQTEALLALSQTGEKGFELLLSQSNLMKNPTVRANAAIGLMKQRGRLDFLQIETLSDALAELIESSHRLVWKEEGVCDQRWGFAQEGIYDAVAVDLQAKLQLIALLSLISPLEAKDSLKGLLVRERWGIGGAAAALLLQECDGDARDLVEQLMEEDHNIEVRVQAALILAMWSHNTKAVGHLIDAYDTADRALKERILEGLASIGHQRALPFLVDRMEESSETIRLLAALATVKTLYH